jgi:hypothetical protein
MAEPIQANYVPDGDDWTITVSGRGKTLTASAPGIIAARDRTDQLVEELAPNEEHRTVVHLLNGDAVLFTTAYLTARMAKSEPSPASPVESPPVSPQDAPAPPASPVEAEEKQPARRTPGPRTHGDGAEATARAVTSEAEPGEVTSPS